MYESVNVIRNYINKIKFVVSIYLLHLHWTNNRSIYQVIPYLTRIWFKWKTLPSFQNVNCNFKIFLITYFLFYYTFMFIATVFSWLSRLYVTLNINKRILQKVERNSTNDKMESIFMFAFAFVICLLRGKVVLFLLFFSSENMKLRVCILFVFVNGSKMVVKINAKLWLKRNRHEIWCVILRELTELNSFYPSLNHERTIGFCSNLLNFRKENS